MTAIRFPSLLFTPGRDCEGPTAVVLHEYRSGLEMLDKEMDRCLRPRPLCSPGCHTSFHYGVGACHLHQYVDLEDTAWGFWFEPTPVCPVPPCPIVQECDGIGADQYNPDFDGNPATPDVTASPACQDANCSVIHVAVVTGITTVSDGIFCINSPTFNERAYRCLVQSLCEIFDVAGLIPVSGTTLLTHIGELVNVDVDQLADDILECLTAPVPPLPPCDCIPIETANTVVDTATLDLTASGPFNRNITGNVRISATAGNQIVANLDGLFVPADTEVPITVVDTPSINLTASGTDNHTIQADAVVSPNADNQVSILGNGLFVSETSITANDSGTIDLTVSGFANHTITADVIISPIEGNQLIDDGNGLFVPTPIAPNTCGGPLEETDTLVTIEAFEVAAPTTETNNIWVSQTDQLCPRPLRAETCDGSMQVLDVVLGTNSTLAGDPVWGRPQRPTLDVIQFTSSTLEIGPDSGDVFVYTGATPHGVDLIAPLGTCSKNDIWIKNRGTAILTVTPDGGTIDGAASIPLNGTNPGTFPFGTDGGDTVHLVWNGTIWNVIG